MQSCLADVYGNASATHSYGRAARVAIEQARRNVADLLHARTDEIFFTSGGTEANNIAIQGAVQALGIRHIITSRLEHQSVLQPIADLVKSGAVTCKFVDLDASGHIECTHLEHLLKQHPKALVSLMHANNEIGNLADLARIGKLCKEHEATLHTDMVQTLGRYTIDLQDLCIHMCTGTAHKLHGPKGTGMLYVSHQTHVKPLIHGGEQERGMRGGTENIAGIVGFSQALQIAHADLHTTSAHIRNLKEYMIRQLQQYLPGVIFHGASANLEESLYTILNVGLPPALDLDSDTLLFKLDIEGIAASAGSACTSGSTLRSHVLEALKTDPERPAVRFSLGRYNTIQEIDYVVDKLTQIHHKATAV